MPIYYCGPLAVNIYSSFSGATATSTMPSSRALARDRVGRQA